ncbi:hypothetical protein [Kamptonema formosum]|uniref:hypothetical protein n=1 Tax=Kamptonema formosum TaxID=331992 RepID=UPI00034C277D|nr:hypothetical protein [Kamptonema formosum]
MNSPTAKMPTSEEIAAAIETIDHLTAWLQDTGLSASAIAQFKFNSLASMYPELRGIAETAKQLIGAASPLTEVGMTVTELAAVLTDSLELKIKPDVVNKALVVLGYQERNEAKRIWILTEAGKTHGISLLATSSTNKWSGNQLKWYRSIIPILEEYLTEAGILENGSSNDCTAIADTEQSKTSEKSLVSIAQNGSSPSNGEKATWTVPERIKVLGITVNPSQIELIQSFADDAYTKHYNSTPLKSKVRKNQFSTYPSDFIEFLDRAIQTVLNPKKA